MLTLRENFFLLKTANIFITISLLFFILCVSFPVSIFCFCYSCPFRSASSSCNYFIKNSGKCFIWLIYNSKVCRLQQWYAPNFNVWFWNHWIVWISSFKEKVNVSYFINYYGPIIPSKFWWWTQLKKKSNQMSKFWMGNCHNGHISYFFLYLYMYIMDVSMHGTEMITDTHWFVPESWNACSMCAINFSEWERE